MSAPDPAGVAALAAGLRRLADVVEATPAKLPAVTVQWLLHEPGTDVGAAMLAIATAAGCQWVTQARGGTQDWYVMWGDLGGITVEITGLAAPGWQPPAALTALAEPPGRQA